jgi:hypothetical protein
VTTLRQPSDPRGKRTVVVAFMVFTAKRPEVEDDCGAATACRQGRSLPRPQPRHRESSLGRT